MLVRHSRDMHGNGEDWDPAADLGMACSARVQVQCIKIDAHNTNPLDKMIHGQIRQPSFPVFRFPFFLLHFCFSFFHFPSIRILVLSGGRALVQGVMLFNASNACITRKLCQRNRRRRCRHLLTQSLQEGGIGQGMCVKTSALQQHNQSCQNYAPKTENSARVTCKFCALFS